MTTAPNKPRLKNSLSRSPNVFIVIEKLLIEHGAIDFSYELVDSKKVALRFSLVVDGEELRFRMPARVDRVRGVLLKQARNQKEIIAAGPQAYQTAWATVRDWLSIQFAMITMDATEPAEIFLPYLIVDGGKKTLFHLMREQKLLSRPSKITELPERGANT